MATDLIGTTEAAERCGVERSTFFRWMQLGQIDPAGKLSGPNGALLFDPDDVERLRLIKVAERENEAAS